jgi:hypothetical protein
MCLHGAGRQALFQLPKVAEVGIKHQVGIDAGPMLNGLMAPFLLILTVTSDNNILEFGSAIPFGHGGSAQQCRPDPSQIYQLRQLR